MRMSKLWTPVIALAMVAGFSTLSRAEDPAGGTAATGSVSGTVVDKDSKPVANAQVRVVVPNKARTEPPANKPAADAKIAVEDPADKGGDKGADKGGDKAKQGGRRMEAVAQGVTDAEGKFMIEKVPAGEYNVIAAGPTKTTVGREKVTVKAGETATVEIKLQDRPPRGAGGAGGAGGGAADKTK